MKINSYNISKCIEGFNTYLIFLNTYKTPQLSERAGADACLSTLHSKIDPSELAAKGVVRARRLCCLRRETAFSPESAAGSSEAGSSRSPFCSSSRRGIDRRWGFGASLL